MDAKLIALELGKLFFFMIFVTAFLEVIKVGYLRFTARSLKVETVKLLNFFLGLLFCYAFDYGVMSRIAFVGDKSKGSLAHWIDYLGTAALVYMGAEWVFHKFSASIEQAKALKKLAQDDTTSSVVTKTATSESKITTEVKPVPIVN